MSSCDTMFEKLAVADFEGLYQEHMHMWDVFRDWMKMQLTVFSIPFAGAAVIVGTGGRLAETGLGVVPLRELPPLLTLLLGGAGVLGFVMLHVLVRHRLELLLYARALNSFRSLYVDHLQSRLSFSQELSAWRSTMPTTSKAPLNFEPLRTMGLLLTAFGLVVSVYVALAVANLFRDMSVWHVVLIGALVLGAQYLFYYLAACAEPIAGVRDKRPESRPDVTPPVGRP